MLKAQHEQDESAGTEEALVLKGLFRQPKQMPEALTLTFFMCKKTLSLFVYCSQVFYDL